MYILCTKFMIKLFVDPELDFSYSNNISYMILALVPCYLLSPYYFQAHVPSPEMNQVNKSFV